MSISTLQKTTATQENFVQAIDPEVVLERVDGDLEFLQELADLFFENSDALLASLQEAIDSADASNAGSVAHALKGAVGNFGAMRAYNLAYELEKMGKSGNLTQARQKFAELQSELEAVKTQIYQMLEA